MHVNNTSWEFPFYRIRNKLLLTWILPNASFGGMVQGIPMRKQIYCHVWLNNWIFWKKASDLLNLNYFLLMVYSTRVGESLVHWPSSVDIGDTEATAFYCLRWWIVSTFPSHWSEVSSRDALTFHREVRTYNGCSFLGKRPRFDDFVLTSLF